MRLASLSSWERLRELRLDALAPHMGMIFFAASLDRFERCEAVLLSAKVLLNEMAERSRSHPRDPQEVVLALDQPHGKSVDAENVLAL